MLIRHCKIVLVAIIAAFFTLAAFRNITDYLTNYTFIQHVLSMDSVFPDSRTVWRAISSPVLQTISIGELWVGNC